MTSRHGVMTVYGKRGKSSLLELVSAHCQDVDSHFSHRGSCHMLCSCI